MKKQINVPKGRDAIAMSVHGHTYVRLIDATGKETFRFDSPGEHVTAAAHPGDYTIETDGKLGEVDTHSIDAHGHSAEQFDAMKPPMPER